MYGSVGVYQSSAQPMTRMLAHRNVLPLVCCDVRTQTIILTQSRTVGF